MSECFAREKGGFDESSPYKKINHYGRLDKSSPTKNQNPINNN
jgi:hypothetical protein